MKFLRWMVGLAAAGGLLSGIPAVGDEGSSSQPVVILFTSYRTYKDAALAVETALKEAGYPSVLVEVPADVDKAAEEGAADSRERRVGSAPATAASGEIDKVLKRIADAKPAVVVTSGASATSFALERIPKTPIVFCMVPNALDMPFLAPGSPDRSRLAGVTTDAAPDNQVDWIRKLCPKVRNVGVLCSDRSRRTAEAIQTQAKKQGLTVTAINSRQNEFPKAVDALNSTGCDAVLMLPDAGVYNSANVQRLLLWGIRQKRPVWAFSANIVKAGAFAGQFADSQGLSRQTADLARKVLEGASVAKTGLAYPRDVQTAVNERTAELIGISFDPQTLSGIAIRYGKEQ